MIPTDTDKLRTAIDGGGNHYRRALAHPGVSSEQIAQLRDADSMARLVATGALTPPRLSSVERRTRIVVIAVLVLVGLGAVFCGLSWLWVRA